MDCDCERQVGVFGVLVSSCLAPFFSSTERCKAADRGFFLLPVLLLLAHSHSQSETAGCSSGMPPRSTWTRCQKAERSLALARAPEEAGRSRDGHALFAIERPVP